MFWSIKNSGEVLSKLTSRGFRLISLSTYVNQIYPPELQLNKAYTSNTEALFLDFHLSISYGFVSFKIYDNMINFLSWMVMFHVSPLMECTFLNSKDLRECVAM